ncbi:MAG TPA: Uma2 family endonuclease [Candidatus Saccharimonadales bacterium]|nr:Uma2 family endonuclease [Candidatus Saccharimonadales bacterium]
MPMVLQTGPWTVDMVRALPDDGNRYECVDGVLLVTPAARPPHELVLARLQRAVDRYLEANAPTLHAFSGPSEITWGEERTYLQPDLYVAPEREFLGSWTRVRSLPLAVEVLSPSSVEHDRVTKRPVYQRHGVGTYWVVDMRARAVEVWRAGDETPEAVTSVLRWQVAPDAPVLEIRLSEVFADIPARVE